MIIFLVSSLIILLFVCSLLYIMQVLKHINWKPRRTGRNTEETSVPLEEASLCSSSDYRVVPIIDRETIRIDSKIGQPIVTLLLDLYNVSLNEYILFSALKNCNKQTIKFKGAFGEVFSADWCGSPTGRVAIKTLYHLERDYSEIAKEARLLTQLEHPNIVRLFGIAKEKQQVRFDCIRNFFLNYIILPLFIDFVTLNSLIFDSFN
ncbi:unnamed protein product [Anisakis simplex]|uniref:Protein kinase domain-containing protein n=1 Tax=Anisakis simplex TaxID=6269 RepID=A0A0M3JAN3_ANISI|nr:unnamed protein product [Anisakis simplex]